MAICPSWLSFILYNPVRKALTDRSKVLDESGITPSSVVIEIGAGNGFLTEAIAERAKKVVAVELQDGMVRKLMKRVRRFGSRVEIVHDDIAKYDTAVDLADVCLMYYSFHEISDQKEASVKISRAIKPGGILSIYEPAFEVKEEMMKKTIHLFESMGFKKELEQGGRFTRFARLKKEVDGKTAVE